MTELGFPPGTPEPPDSKESFVPSYPFALHVPREGEPPFPTFTPLGRVHHEPLSDLEHEGRKAWRTWALQQPDSRLLYTEYLFAQLWVSSKGDLISEEISLTLEEQIKAADQLRDQGYGQIIDTYWPHLRHLAK